MNFGQLKAIAEDTLQNTLRRAPPAMRKIAHDVPVLYYPVPTPDMISDGIEEDLLGLFDGYDPADIEAAPDPSPPVILLFLQNIWDYAEHSPDRFREEVSITFLHELGHRLGLTETDLIDRDLD